MSDTLMSLLDNWWIPVVRGVLAIIFGIFMLTSPGPSTLLALLVVFGVYAIVDGIFALVSVFRSDRRIPRWALVLEGITGIGAGVMVFLLPGLTALSLFVVIAVWAIVTGILEIAFAFHVRHYVAGELFLFSSGVLSLLLGVLMLARPAAGLTALVWLVGIYALFFGVILILSGMYFRHLRDEARHGGPVEPILRPF